jgi:hypothetical protein
LSADREAIVSGVESRKLIESAVVRDCRTADGCDCLWAGLTRHGADGMEGNKSSLDGFVGLVCHITADNGVWNKAKDDFEGR